MSDTDITQRGQALTLECIFWEGPAGEAPLDLTGATVSVRECNPAILQAATITVADAEQGQVRLALTEAQADQLGSGRVNWFRIEAQYSGDNRVTPKIWINVQ